MFEQASKAKIIIIIGLILAIGFFQYATELTEHSRHLLFQGLFFIPVMLAGFWFGLWPALVTSFGITTILIPFTFIHWHGLTVGDINNVLEMGLYSVVAIILGKLKDQEKAQQRRLRESERLAAMGRALSGLAHDLRTPLIAIGGLIRLAKKHLEHDDAYHQKLDIVIEETQRLDHMVKDILDFSRPLELHPSRGDLNQVLHRSVGITAELALRKGVLVQTRSLPNLPSFSFDLQRAEQAFINLLINAVEASAEGETVIVSTYRRGGKAIVDVTDHGCGIPPDKTEEIFFPFFTTKKEGTGLGLPIVKKIVEAHRGTIEVIKNPDKGLTFRMIIPIAV